VSAVADSLRRVRELLRDPSAWIQNAYARRADGAEVRSLGMLYSLTGATFSQCSLYGAVYVVAGSTKGARPRGPWFMALLGVLASGLPDEWEGDLVRWHNDPARTHADVIALLDAAIAAQE
jgi:hypothetical protein